MISEYVSKALKKAKYKQLEDDSWYGDIDGFVGIWANGPSIEHCRQELIEVLEEWLLLKIRDGDAIPQKEILRQAGISTEEWKKTLFSKLDIPDS